MFCFPVGEELTVNSSFPVGSACDFKFEIILPRWNGYLSFSWNGLFLPMCGRHAPCIFCPLLSDMTRVYRQCSKGGRAGLISPWRGSGGAGLSLVSFFAHLQLPHGSFGGYDWWGVLLLETRRAKNHIEWSCVIHFGVWQLWLPLGEVRHLVSEETLKTSSSSIFIKLCFHYFIMYRYRLQMTTVMKIIFICDKSELKMCILNTFPVGIVYYVLIICTFS